MDTGSSNGIKNVMKQTENTVQGYVSSKVSNDDAHSSDFGSIHAFLEARKSQPFALNKRNLIECHYEKNMQDALKFNRKKSEVPQTDALVPTQSLNSDLASDLHGEYGESESNHQPYP